MGLEVTVACPPRRDEPVTSARTGGVHRKRSVTVRHRNRSCKGCGARYHRTRVGLATIRGGGPPTTHPGKEHHDVAMSERVRGNGQRESGSDAIPPSPFENLKRKEGTGERHLPNPCHERGYVVTRGIHVGPRVVASLRVKRE
ncbi:hypothetical protein BHE74_00005110 [Ensete ventricosum]|nr:hypothetical protein BHE74_00005110 [Ensete ventricosum]